MLRLPAMLLAVTVFLGSFLLFQLQPIVAKAILPWFGGAPAVWTTCMVFFQSLLLAGYACAHGSARALKPRAQGMLQLGLVAVALCTLPILPHASQRPAGTDNPVLAILGVLGRSTALPYFVLCASTPLVQSWSAARAGASSPYRLYALSNAGSMLALLSYPLAVEPWLSTRSQAWVWSALFALFALATAGCVRGLWRADAAATPRAEPVAAGDAPTARRRWLWLALPACATTLLLAITNQMCQEVAVVPLLWIVPLSLYLLSFVLCFESERWYSRAWCIPLLIVALALIAQALAMGPRIGILLGVPVYSAGLFVCCMFCHGELAALRPAPRHLTAYYLMIALGGALGGVFVSVVSPFLFRGFDELYVGLLACGILATAFVFRSPRARTAAAAAWSPALPALIVVVLLIGAAFGMRMMARAQTGLRELRNFYGILRIQDLLAPEGEGRMRYLTHGGTRHGQQYQDAARRGEPTAYFGHASGAGILLDGRAERPLRMGVIGLGAGVLAAYGRAGDTFRFYEINPLVIEIARRDFTFLADSRAKVEIVPGDARLSLEAEPDQAYDVFVVDAFSSDSIPVHLLTREAFELYGRHLAEGGVLALHVTNRHLDLGPLIAGLARAEDLETWQIDSAADDALATLDAHWIFVTSNRELLARPDIRAAGHALAGEPLRPWTDDYSNLLRVLN